MTACAARRLAPGPPRRALTVARPRGSRPRAGVGHIAIARAPRVRGEGLLYQLGHNPLARDQVDHADRLDGDEPPQQRYDSGDTRYTMTIGVS